MKYGEDKLMPYCQMQITFTLRKTKCKGEYKSEIQTEKLAKLKGVILQKGQPLFQKEVSKMDEKYVK